MTSVPPNDDRAPRKRRRAAPTACETGTPHAHMIQDARGVRHVDCDGRELEPDDPRIAALRRHVTDVAWDVLRERER